MKKCIQPSYVKDFRCDGKLCEARCCRDWRIVVDDDAFEKYSNLPDAAREKVFENLDWVEDEQEDVDVLVLKLREDGVCSFLGKDCLCKLQKRYGEDYLTAICQSYPRVTYRLGGEIFEQSMTLTCPIAAHLILFPETPMTFEKTQEVSARAVIGFKQKLSRPVDEFINLQMDAIKILQDRNLPVNQRLKKLCAMFENLPEYEFDIERHTAALIDVFANTYSANLSQNKKLELRKNYLTYRDEILNKTYNVFGHMLENYLVNEFFMRCYPCAFSGGEFHNIKIFVTGFKVLEFALVLTIIAKRKLNIDEVTTLIYSVNDMLDHSRGGMDAIIDFAKTCDSKTFAELMLED